MMRRSLRWSLESWGFNTVGAWSDDQLFAPLMSYSELLNYGGNTWPPIVGQHWFEYVDQPLGGRRAD